MFVDDPELTRTMAASFVRAETTDAHRDSYGYLRDESDPLPALNEIVINALIRSLLSGCA